MLIASSPAPGSDLEKAQKLAIACKDHCDAIDLCTTREEVLSVDFTVGWSE